jgi:hypothetical protein
MTERVAPGGFVNLAATEYQRPSPYGFSDSLRAALAAGSGELGAQIAPITVSFVASVTGGNALGSLGSAGYNANRTDSATLFVNTTQTLPAGTVLVAAVAYDLPTSTTVANLSAVGGAVVISDSGDGDTGTGGTETTINAATWTNPIRKYDATNSLDLFYTRLLTDLPSGSPIAVSFSDSSESVLVARKAITLWAYSAVAAVLTGGGSGTSIASGSSLGAIALSNLTSRRYLFYRASVKIGPYDTGNITPTFTDNTGSWTALSPATTLPLVDNSDSAFLLRGEWILLTDTAASSNPTWNVPGSAQSAILALYQGPEATSADGALEKTFSRFTLDSVSTLVSPAAAASAPKQHVTPEGFVNTSTAANIDRASPTGFVNEVVVNTDERTFTLDATISNFTLTTANTNGVYTGGQLDATISAFTFSGVGGVQVNLTSDVSIGNLTLSTAAGFGNGGLDRTISAITLNGVGALSSAGATAGALSQTISAITLSGVSDIDIAGALDATVPAFTLATVGGVPAPGADVWTTVTPASTTWTPV